MEQTQNRDLEDPDGINDFLKSKYCSTTVATQ